VLDHFIGKTLSFNQIAFHVTDFKQKGKKKTTYHGLRTVYKIFIINNVFSS